MSGERLGQALLDLDTNDKKFDKNVDRAEKKATGLGRTFDLTAAKAAKMGAQLAAAAAVGVAALAALVRVSINQADAMSKAAQRAGVTTEALSRLAWAGEQSDVNMSTLTGSMVKLTKTMSDVASGADKGAAALFRALDVSVTDAEGKLRSADSVMIDLADRFSRMEEGADKTALAIKVFGKSGAEMIPLLNNGRQGLADMAAESDRLGKTISTDFGKRAEVFNDTLSRIWAAGAGLVNKIAEALLPQLQEFADMLADPQFVENAQSLAQGVVAAFGLIVDAVKKAVGALRWMGETIEWLGTHDIFGNPLDDAQTRRRAEILALMEGGPKPLSSGAFDARYKLPDPPKRDDGDKSPVKIDWEAIERDKAAAAATDSKREAVARLIRQLEIERDVMRETDPVQREMIRLSETLAAAKGDEKKQVEELIRSNLREAEAKREQQEYTDILKGSVSSLAMAVRNGENVWDALADNALRALDRITDKLLNEVLDAVFTVNSATGGGGGGGLFGSLFGGLFGGGSSSLFSGFYAQGGLIPSGTFGIVGERGPEPVIGTTQGAKVLPNSSLRGLGGGGTEVNIYNNTGGEVREERRQGADGREIVDIIIERVKQEFATGGFDEAQGSRFGVSPRKVRR